MSDDVVEEIKARLSLSTIIGRRTKLVRRGRSLIGLCPFHSEKTPSFHVHDDKGFYNCFGCGAKGDVFTFVQQTENLGFREALERLAGEAGVALPERSRETQAAVQRRQTLHDAVEAACAFFETQLKGQAGAAARAYLDRRGLAPETVARFRLGFAPPGGTQLKDALAARGFSEDMLVEAGLIRRGEEGRRTHDWFRDRVTFPIMDRRGRPVAFGARLLGPGEPKYLNSPETPLFHKGETLFNLDKARPAALENSRLLVVEGYMDVIALAQAGLPQAVAPLGTALTEAQLALMWKAVPEPILCFDGDTAGQRAAARALDRALPLLTVGHSLRFLTLPDGLDPDELIRRDGVKAMEDLIGRAAPLIEALWTRELAAADLSTPDGAAAFEARLTGIVRGIGDKLVEFSYREEVRHRLRQARRARQEEAWEQRRKGPGRDGARPARIDPWKATALLAASPVSLGLNAGVQRTERLLIHLLLLKPHLVVELEAELEDLIFMNPQLDALREALLRIVPATPALDSGALKDHLASEGWTDCLAEIERDTLGPLMSFARDAATNDEALAGWRHTLDLHRRNTSLRADIEDARNRYEADPTEAGMQQLKALGAELHGVERASY